VYRHIAASQFIIRGVVLTNLTNAGRLGQSNPVYRKKIPTKHLGYLTGDDNQ
jgi:hypothetical protein